MKIKMNWPEVWATLGAIAAAVALVTWAWFSIPVHADEAGHAIEDTSGVVVPAPMHGIIPPLDRSDITYGVEVNEPPAAAEVEKETFPIDIPRCTDAIADAGGTCYGEPLPPCATEDSTNCYWDAQTMGNGQGTSFVDEDPIYDDNDMLIYADGTWHDLLNGNIGCTEGYPCDKSGKYEILPAYPADFETSGQMCWLNLMEQVVCLKKEVQP